MLYIVICRLYHCPGSIIIYVHYSCSIKRLALTLCTTSRGIFSVLSLCIPDNILLCFCIGDEYNILVSVVSKQHVAQDSDSIKKNTTKQGAPIVILLSAWKHFMDCSTVRGNQSEHWALETVWILERLRQLKFMGQSYRKSRAWKDRALQIR